MVKTTLYLPEELKARLEQVARREGRSEADLVREALTELVRRRIPPKPRGALVDSGDPDWAARADQDLSGFGT
ncbi:MAG: CopG family transcriptional regulator [Pseudonocardia sp.]